MPFLSWHKRAKKSRPIRCGTFIYYKCFLDELAVANSMWFEQLKDVDLASCLIENSKGAVFRPWFHQTWNIFFKRDGTRRLTIQWLHQGSGPILKNVLAPSFSFFIVHLLHWRLQTKKAAPPSFPNTTKQNAQSISSIIKCIDNLSDSSCAWAGETGGVPHLREFRLDFFL